MNHHWKKLRGIVSVKSQWLDIYCEEWQKPCLKKCEYWRVEKPDSLIVIPIYQSQVILAAPTYRPGVGRCTIDLPGGRFEEPGKQDIHVAVTRILGRELLLDQSNISKIKILDGRGTLINSSFTNQKLLLARADLMSISGIATNVRLHPVSEINTLLPEIECLQCSYALLYFQSIYLR